jgi:hypothetical protein
MQSEPVLVPGIVFSDSIIREAGSNKLSLIGCFGRFHFDKFPGTTGVWYATVGITGIRDATTFNVTGRVEVADSAHVISSTNALVQFQGQQPSITPDAIFEIPLPFNGVTFPKEGIYTVVVLVDTEEVGRRRLDVVPRQQPPPPQTL